MKKISVGLLVALGLLSAGASNLARAHTRVGIGINVGIPVGGWYRAPYYGPAFYGPSYYGPYFAPYPAYYPGPVVVTPQPVSQPVYIETAPAAAPGPASSNAWYYCSNPDGYYPYIKQCPGGWRTVSPQPPQ